jgi:hypothetical protein
LKNLQDSATHCFAQTSRIAACSLFARQWLKLACWRMMSFFSVHDSRRCVTSIKGQQKLTQGIEKGQSLTDPAMFDMTLSWNGGGSGWLNIDLGPYLSRGLRLNHRVMQAVVEWNGAEYHTTFVPVEE